MFTGDFEGYRVVSLSMRSLEDMRRRCMVRVMFNRWLLPHTPSESVKKRGERSANLLYAKGSSGH